MISILLLALAVSSTYLSPSAEGMLGAKQQEIRSLLKDYTFFLTMPSQLPKIESPSHSVREISEMLYKESDTLPAPVINKVLTIMRCAKSSIANQNILSIIDYSKPSNEKRLWIFSLKDKKKLFHTYVSHGIKSGTLLSQNFSNTNNSKATSIGVYQTGQTYWGRDGLSLRFLGLDSGFNSNAMLRLIVMHGGWYVSEEFIKKYGRPGRSWGCPAVPEDVKKAIIHTIKENSLFVAYYPYEDWFAKSKFLNCNDASYQNARIDKDKEKVQYKPMIVEDEKRDEVLFADLYGKKNRENNEAILVMPADKYEQIFHLKPPLGRMLRRQIAEKEYIALSRNEFKNVVDMQKSAAPQGSNSKEALDAIYFVIPVIKMIHGYYETQMHIVDTGKVVEANADALSVKTDSNKNLNLRGSKVFIRWLGL